MAKDISVYPQQDLLTRLLKLKENFGIRYRKISEVLAKKVTEDTKLDTIVESGFETTNQARPGDYIVKNLTRKKEMYVMKPDKFKERYEFIRKSRGYWSLFRPKSEVTAFAVNNILLDILDKNCPFFIETSWNDTMPVNFGDFLVIPPNENEVYRVAASEFYQTYAPI